MRIARLDGIRAVAVILVVLFHLTNHVTFGWVGVQLFFVLSGYLITGILRDTIDEPGYWSRFYKRRAARILPPMLLLIDLCTIFAKDRQFPTILGYTFFAGNIMNLTRYGRLVLDPLWSLAVEEHFYLLWPLAVLLLNRRRLMILLGCVLIAEPILRAFTPSTFYRLTPFELDGLAAGCLLALVLEGGIVLPKATGWFALILLPGLWFCTRTPGALTNSYLALLFVLFLGWVVGLDDGFFYRLLSAKPVAYLGRISYGVYLFHVPVGSVIHVFPLSVLVTIGMAALSFHFLETPIIEYAKGKRRPVREETEQEWADRQW